jgi:carboxypeptidase T
VKSIALKSRIVCILMALFLLAVTGLSTLVRASESPAAPDGPVVVRVYYGARENLDTLANTLDIWEVDHEQAYLVALVSADRYLQLFQAGYRLEIDAVRTAELYQPHEPLPGQGVDSIPGYPCYRTVEETYIAMESLATNNPSLATWMDIGDSWDKLTAGGPTGYDLFALDLTNKITPGPKPVFFLMAEIHAREYVTAETAARFAEYLVSNYGLDPDITWLLDYYHVYIVPMTNPDGRKKAETGLSWRKNTDSDDGCSVSSSWGTDLNRNSSFKWNTGGSSPYPCDETYHGPMAGSEPEVNTFQGFVTTLFPDQRGPGDNDPAPVDTTGVFITLHSYSQLVLWPWGWTTALAPNYTQLQTLGRKLAYFNSYTPQQAYQLYQTSGTSDDWAYGELGIAAYTFEMGTTFFQGCGSYESTIYPDNLEALMAAFKSARRPYMEPSGPEALSVLATPSGVGPGENVVLTATLDDTRFYDNIGSEPTQNIAAAEYYLDTPPWITDTVPVAYPMAATDGSFNETIEEVTATIDTTGLSLGRHMVFVRGQDASGNWGVVSAAFLYIVEPGVSPSIEGYVRDAGTNQPLAATLKAGAFQTLTDPTTGFYNMTVISGTYELTAEASGYAPVTVMDVQAQNYQNVQQDFYLLPTCEIFSDDVESGNIGWTAQSPWGITTGYSHSPTHSWTESPSGNYGNNRDISLTSPTIDLSGYTGVRLDFWQRYVTESGWDYCYVEYSNDGGSTWATGATFDGSHTAWEEQNFALPALDGFSNARLRFRFTSDTNTVYDGWYIDDISLTGGGAGCITPMAPTAEFTSSATTVSVGEPVQFTDLSYGTPPFTYLWDFGDGLGTSTLANPTYAYLATGTYTVTLAVTNTLGSDSISHPILVQEAECIPLEQVQLSLLNPGPLQPEEVAHFSADFLPVFFTRPVTYTVDFGDATPPVDGSSSDAPLLFDHAFAVVGDYQVTIAALNCSMTVPVTSSLMASVISYTAGLEVSPLAQAGFGDPGTPVTYTFTVTNTGEQPDLIYVSLVESSWLVSLPDPIGPLASGDSASVLVTVTVPSNAAAGVLDAASLQFASTHPSAELVTATLTTTANTVYGLEVTPAGYIQYGFPGSTVTYTFQVTNTGNTTDTFTVIPTSDWEVIVPSNIGPLEAGESITIMVLVTVPVLAPDGQQNIASLRFTSQENPTQVKFVEVSTVAAWYGVWIPIIVK